MEVKGYDFEVGVIGSLLIDPDPILGDMMAAVSAALAEMLGTHINGIRIHSIKQI